MVFRRILASTASFASLLLALDANAQTAPGASVATSAPLANGSTTTPPAEERVLVTGARRTDVLNQVNGTGSSLNLTPRQTPASVNIITAATMLQRGYATVQDAVTSAPGITVGGSPADPSSFTMRGFTGDQINLLRDGTYYGPSDMVNRPENSFNLRDIEVLKGPASVLYGQGAVGGVINVITRQPTFTPTRWDAQFSYGSFNTINAGIGVNSAIGDAVAVNMAFSRTSSDGWVHHDNPDSLDFNGSVLWRIRPDLRVQAGLDVMKDDLPSSYGTPLIAGASDPNPISGLFKSSSGLSIDSATRFSNYNNADSVHKALTISPNLLVTWDANSHVTVTNEIYEYYAERRWQNAETYTALPDGSSSIDGNGVTIPPGSVGRDRFYVYHQQHLYGDQAHVAISHSLFGMQNRMTFGIDASYLQFLRSRGFPDAGYADYVSLLNPVQGQFGNFPGLYPQKQSPTQISDLAGLFEDALSITHNLRLVVGLRSEWLRLNRQNYNAAGIESTTSGFAQTYNPSNYRVGVVYDIIPALTLYAQYTTAEDPPGSNIFLANKGQVSNLSKSSQEEAGLKTQFWHDRISATLAFYNIERKNILASTSANTVADVGGQKSRGAEFELDTRLVPQWTVSVSAAYTHSRFGTFVDPNSGIDASGNPPPDVPTWSAGLFTNYSSPFGLPLDIGGDVRYVGERAGDYGNTLRLDAYTLVDLNAAYHLTKSIDITGRINNLLDKTYVAWADVNYPTELLLGRPRYFELGVHVGF